LHLNFRKENEGLSRKNRAGIGSTEPSRMRRCYPNDREALRPEFEELVDLLELIRVLELNLAGRPREENIKKAA